MTNTSTTWPALRRLRQRRGLSLYQVADRVPGLTATALSKIERGLRPGTTHVRVVEILDALEYSLATLEREASA